MKECTNTFIVFDPLTRRLFPYTDDPKLFNEEYIQQAYCNNYKAKLVFLNTSNICRLTLKHVLGVSWEQLDNILSSEISQPTRTSNFIT
jgi:hypothetical protein